MDLKVKITSETGISIFIATKMTDPTAKPKDDPKISVEEKPAAPSSGLFGFGSLRNMISDSPLPLSGLKITSPTQLVTTVQSQLKNALSNVMSEFDKEQQQFVETKRQSREPVLEEDGGRVAGKESLPPWLLPLTATTTTTEAENEGGKQSSRESDHEQIQSQLKSQILALSKDARNVTVDPPENAEFTFDLTAIYPVAMATLRHDPRLDKLRFDLVPKQVSEYCFWRNYFYRVSLVKRSVMLNFAASVSTDDQSKSVSNGENEKDIDTADELIVDDRTVATERSLNEKKEKQEDSDWIDSIESELQKEGVMDTTTADDKDAEAIEAALDDPDWESKLQQELGL